MLLCWTKSPWFRIEPIGSSLDQLPSFYRKLPHKCFSTTRKKIFLLSGVMLWNFFLVGFIYSGIVLLFCFICYIWETVSSISLYFIGGLWGVVYTRKNSLNRVFCTQIFNCLWSIFQLRKTLYNASLQLYKNTQANRQIKSENKRRAKFLVCNQESHCKPAISIIQFDNRFNSFMISGNKMKI